MFARRGDENWGLLLGGDIGIFGPWKMDRQRDVNDVAMRWTLILPILLQVCRLEHALCAVL